MEFSVNNELRCIESNEGFSVGDLVTMTKEREVYNGKPSMEITGCGKENIHVYQEHFELVSGNSNLRKTMDMKVFKVLIVNKKTKETEKEKTVVAADEQQAILKTFDVDAENVFIKIDELGSYPEDKPIEAVIVEEDKKSKQ